MMAGKNGFSSGNGQHSTEEKEEGGRSKAPPNAKQDETAKHHSNGDSRNGKGEYVPLETYQQHIDRYRNLSNYFTFFRLYYKVMSRLESVFIQDLVNLSYCTTIHTKIIDGKRFFMCTESFLFNSQSGWTQDEQRRHLASLQERGYVYCIRRGLPSVRWVSIDRDKIDADLDRFLRENPSQGENPSTTPGNSQSGGKPLNCLRGKPPRKNVSTNVDTKKEQRKEEVFASGESPPLPCISNGRSKQTSKHSGDNSTPAHSSEKKRKGINSAPKGNDSASFFEDSTGEDYDFWSKVATRLYARVKEVVKPLPLQLQIHENRSLETIIKRWRSDLLSALGKEPGFSRESFYKSFNWLLNHFGEQYVPKPCSGKKLAQQYLAGDIDAAIEREKEDRLGTRFKKKRGFNDLELGEDDAEELNNDLTEEEM